MDPTPLPRDTAPPMSEAEYLASLQALDTERAELRETYITSQIYPRWGYHETEPPQLVHSDEEALALGAGWSAVPLDPPPPEVTSLEPDTVAIGQPSFTLRVLGTGFTAESVIVFNGYDEPTTFVSATEVTTGVNMDVWTGPSLPLPVLVRLGDVESNALTFTFTAAEAEP